MLDIMYEIPSRDDIKTLEITKAIIRGEATAFRRRQGSRFRMSSSSDAETPWACLWPRPKCRTPTFREPWFSSANTMPKAPWVVIRRETNLSVREVVDNWTSTPCLKPTTRCCGRTRGTGRGFVVFEGDIGDDVGGTATVKLPCLLQNSSKNYSTPKTLPSVSWICRVGPGQLEDEISRFWLYTEAEPDLILQAPVDERYNWRSRKWALAWVFG